MILWDILLILLLIALNGFFVSVEFAVVAARRSRIDILAGEGNRAASIAQTWLTDASQRDRVIAAAQLGVTIVSLMLGAVGENTFEALLAPYFHDLVLPDKLAFMGALISALPLATSLVIVTSLHVVLGEQVPKIAVLNTPERFALLSARPMRFFMTLFRGFISALDWTTRTILRLFGLHAETVHGSVYTLEELKHLVAGPETQGVIEEPQREMLSAIFDFGTRLVRQVMIPRTEVIAVEADTPLRDVVRLTSESRYTKFPVYEENLDQVIGILHVKDLLSVMDDSSRMEQPARTLVREALFVPETLPIGSLLHQFRDRRQHIAIVLDEYGGTAGLVTLEDLLEEITGEIGDPFDVEAPQIQEQADGSVLIDGLALIDEVNEQLGLHLHDENYDTIAGFTIGRLGRIPRVGDVLDVPEEGIRLEVKAMDHLRVARLELTRLPSGREA